MPLIQEWFGAAQIAAAHLTGLPATKRGVLDFAAREGWTRPADEGRRWRATSGRGGHGIEFHISVLPPTARVEMDAQFRVGTADAYVPAAQRGPLWEAFSRLSGKQKGEAQRRLNILLAVRDLMAGMPGGDAVRQVCAEKQISMATYFNWIGAVRGKPRADWLAHLAPRHKGNARRCDIPQPALDWFRSRYGSQSKPSMQYCIRELRRQAKVEGWKLPSNRTLERRLNEIDPRVLAARRDGPKALRAMTPAQRRDRGMFAAMEAVNADGHLFDVMVDWGDGTKGRVMMTAFQDLYSNKILSWRLHRAETAATVRLAFGEMCERFGIPGMVFFDNGRAFAAKENTGGTPNRYRFRIDPEEAMGLLPALGVQVHFVRPAHGQSKPIERAFGDLLQAVAKDTRCEGAYLGNSPEAKPENYGSRTVPIALFAQVVAEAIAEFNARPGRTTDVCDAHKWSFDDAFAASLAARDVPVLRLDVAQREVWMLSSKLLRVRAPDATVHLKGERYHAEFLYAHMGRQVTLRFDPFDGSVPVRAYAAAGHYLGEVEHIPDVPFLSPKAAEAQGRRIGKHLERTKELVAQQMPHTIDEIAAGQAREPVPDEAALPPRVVRLIARSSALPRPVQELPEQDPAEVRMLAGMAKLRLVQQGD